MQDFARSPSPGQHVLALLVIAIILSSVVASVFFQRAMRRCRARPTVFNRLLLLRSYVLQANLATELFIVMPLLQRLTRLHLVLCGFFDGLTNVLAFTITYLTCWLGLSRLLLLAVARWAPRHAWRLTNRLRPNSNNTAVGILLLISTAANTLLLYADATLPPAPPRHRNVLSARRFALLTLCEQLLVLLWAPGSALTAGVTRALLIRVLMIGQAGLMDTVGLALISPQLRLVLLGGRQQRPRRKRTKRVAPVPVIRLELI
ncbi:hypothetical protein FJT64_007280 [Amphibalanus amphitrite]|uniref:Uncharacterized protein n=1 Tax=Amphibalanus amphitrite TaxID=1232801 RepID=A0A6A4VFE7_AMPAM|nr:hypothetical protein FJT64_007280 [Amphibalanus amphitrite]